MYCSFVSNLYVRDCVGNLMHTFSLTGHFLLPYVGLWKSETVDKRQVEVNVAKIESVVRFALMY